MSIIPHKSHFLFYGDLKITNNYIKMNSSRFEAKDDMSYYMKNVKLASVIEGDPKLPFQ